MRRLALALSAAVLASAARGAVWTTAGGGTLGQGRFFHTATLLPDGRVLVTGGCASAACSAAFVRDTAELYDPRNGQWTSAATMASKRRGHVAVLLPNGKVLVAGGTDGSVNLATAEVYDPAANSWSGTSNVMSTSRFAPTLTLLQDGRVLVAAGSGSASADVYDPATNSWSPVDDLIQGRAAHSAVLLRDGRVLVAGGSHGVQISSAEVFNPADGSWTSVPDMAAARASFALTVMTDGRVLAAGGAAAASAEVFDPTAGTWSGTGAMGSIRGGGAVLLPSGKVLMAGGFNGTARILTTEAYDPAAGTWSDAGALATARDNHPLTLLPNGKVLVSGGCGNTGCPTPLSSVELFDPAPGAWTATGGMTTPRFNGAVVSLPDGKVLMAGGNNKTAAGCGCSAVSSAEAYNPETGLYAVVGSMSSARLGMAAALLADGRVLVAGGSDCTVIKASAELYDPGTQSWSPTGGMGLAREGAATALLPDGRVLVAGGRTLGGTPVSTAELYDPFSRSFAPTGSMPAARMNALTVLLPNGKVLIAGGRDGSGPLSTAVLYDPAAGTFAATGVMNSPRQSATATLLPGGKVLVAAGNATDGFANTLTAELYDPGSGIWANTGSLPGTRRAHSAALLPNGKVLVAGGCSDGCGSPLATTVVYDPASASFTAGASMGTTRSEGTIVVLKDGRVLAPGGGTSADCGNTATAGSEVLPYTEYDLLVATAPRPVVASVDGVAAPAAATLRPGSAYEVRGATFTGAGEGSGGSQQSSASNLPRASLLSASGVGHDAFGTPGALVDVSTSLYGAKEASYFSLGRSSSSFDLHVPSGLACGYHRLMVQSNAVPSTFTVVRVVPAAPAAAPGGVPAPILAVSTDSVRVEYALSAEIGVTGYLVRASSDSFATVRSTGFSTVLAQASATVYGLSPNTTYTFQAAAESCGGVGPFGSVPASTSTLANPPASAASTFTAVSSFSASVAWGRNGNPLDVTTYTVVLSTGASYPNGYSGNVSLSTAPAGPAPAATLAGLSDNGTWYLYVAAVNHGGQASSFTALGSTLTAAATPTAVFFDEVSTRSITASAYAPAPAFSSMTVGFSGANVAMGGVYQGWQSGGWTGRNPMPTVRYGAGAAALGGKVYVVGGFDLSNLRKTEEYDPVSDTWSLKADMPTFRAHLAAAAVNGRLYALGGSNGSSLALNHEYDPAANSWTPRTPLPTARRGLTATAVAGRIHAVGGFSTGYSAVHEVYEPVGDVWTPAAPLPAPSAFLAAAAVDGKVFAVGGFNGTTFLTAAAVYDPAADAWTPKAAMPTARRSLAAAAAGGKVHALGGTDGSAALAVHEEYDPGADAWTPRPALPTAREMLSVVAVGGKIYAIGGTASSSLGTVERYDPGVASSFTALSPNTQYMFKARARNLAGVETPETATVSTYTLAAASAPAAGVPLFPAVYATSVTVNWSSGTDAGGYNGPGATYRLEASTMPSFAPVAGSSVTADVSATVAGLSANATHYLRVRPLNSLGVPGDWHLLGATVTMANPALSAVSTFSMVGVTSMTVVWDANSNSAGTRYDVFFTTYFPFSATVSVSTRPEGAPSATATGLLVNATYYPIVFTFNRAGASSGETPLGSTATRIETPSTVLFDAVSSHSIVAVASSPSGAFSNLDQSSSAVNIGLNGVFQDWVAGSSVTVSSGLTPNTPYSFAAKARNVFAVETGESPSVTAYTLAFATLPAAGTPPFSAVNASSLTVFWASGTPTGGYNGSGAIYALAASTMPTFVPIAGSSSTRNPFATVSGLAANTTHYFRVKAYNTVAVTDDVWVLLGATVTAVESPDAVFFDSVSSTTVLARATSAAGGFSNLAVGLSGVDMFVGGAYQGFVAGSSVSFSTGLVPNTNYLFKARARNQIGVETPESNGVSTYTHAAVPSTATPTFLAAFPSSVSLQWTHNGNPAATEFRLRLSSSPGLDGAGDSETGWFTGTSTEAVALAANTTFYVSVRARNAAGVETSARTLGSTVTAAAVPGTAAFGAVATDAAFVSWAANGNAADTLYELEGSTGAFPNLFSGNVAVSTRPSGPPGAATVLTPNATWYFRVRAVSRTGVMSAYAALGSTVTLATAPAAAATPFSSVGDVTLRVAWDAGANPPAVTTYTVVATTGAAYPNGGGANVALTTAPAGAPVDVLLTGLRANTTFNVFVQAFNHAGSSTPWVLVGTTVTLPSAPLPTGPAFGAVDASSLTVRFDAASNAVDTLFEVTAATGLPFPNADPANRTVSTAPAGAASAPLSGLIPNTTWYLHARALGRTGLPSAWTLVASTVTAIEAPASVFFGSVASTSLTAVASAPAGAFTGLALSSSGLNIAVDGAYQGFVDGSSTTFFTGLTPNVLYAFKARARNQVGRETPETASFSTRTLAAVPSSTTPSFAAVWASSAGVQWSGNGNPPGTEFRLEASTASDWTGGADLTSAWFAATSTSAVGLTPNTTYYFQVAARNADGAETAPAPLGSTATLAARPGAPAGSTFTAVSLGSVTVSWTSGGNPADTEFRVVASTAADLTGTLLTSGWLAAQTTTLYGLSQDTTYHWRVAARNRADELSEARDFGPQATLAAAPSLSSEPFHRVWGSSAVVQWGAAGNPATTLYLAEASTSGAFGGTVLGSGWVAFLSTTVTGLTGDATYYWRVKARSVGGVESSALPMGATATFSLEPLGATASWAGPSSVRVDWGSRGNREADSVGAWSTRMPLPTARERHGGALAAGRAYVVGGLVGGAPSAEVWSAGVSPAGTLGSWRREADLPAPRESLAVAVHAGRLYAVGGFDGSAKTSVYSADLSTGGAIAAWRGEPGLPAARYRLAAAAHGGWLYAFGGDNGAVSQTTVYVAPLGQDGRVGAWAPGTGLPAARNSHAAAVSGGRAYVAGGLGAGVEEEVWSAALAGPTVGSWRVETPLPVAVFRHQLVAGGGALVSLGGHDGGAATGTVLSAALGAGGVLGEWRPLGAVPLARFGHVALLETSNVFVLGGADDATEAADTLQAALGGTEYLLERAEDVGFTVNPASTGWRAGSGAELAGLAPNTNYHLRLRSRTRGGVESALVVAGSTLTPAAVPAAAASTFSLVESGSMTLTWQDGGNPVGTQFLAALSTSTDFTAVLDSSWVVAVSTAVFGLSPNTTYYAAVLARDSAQRLSRELFLGATMSAAAVPGSAGFPSVLTTGLSVAWSTAGNPAGTRYEAQLSAAASFSPVAASSVTLSSGAAFSGLLSATTYYLRVRAFNALGTPSGFSGATQAVTGADFTPPAAVTGLALHPTESPGVMLAVWTAPGDDGANGVLPAGSRFHLQWTAADPAGFAWSTGTAQLGPSTGPVSPGAAAGVLVTGMPAGATVYARVWTTDESLNISAFSSTAAAWVSPFTLTRLDGSGVDAGRWASVAVDRSGDAHAAYTAGTITQELRYLRRSGGVWSVAEAPDPGIQAEEAVLALGAGFPQVVYRNSSTGQMRLAKRSAGWTVETVATGDVHPGGLAVDATSFPHISYYDADQPGLRYARWDGVAWQTAVVDAGAGLGRFSSLALDGASAPHIAYYDQAGGDLKFASRTAAGTWSVSTVDNDVDSGSVPVVALDGAGNAVIAYVDYASKDLKLARYDGTAWNFTPIDLPRDVTALRGLALDGAGRPSVTYYDGSAGDLLFGRFDGTGWQTGVVDGYGDVGAWSNLALEADGSVLEVHYDAAGGDLRAGTWSAGLPAPLAGNPRGRVQAPAAFSGVVASSVSIQWTWLDSASNELGWRLYGGLTSTGPFSVVAGTGALPATAGTGTQRIYTETGLTAGTTYYRYVAAVSSGGVVPSPMAALFPFNTTDSAAPTVSDNQADDTVWRRSTGTLYDVDFQDTGGSALTRFQVKAATVPGGAGPDLTAFTDVVINILADSYTADWALPVSVFNAMHDGATHYISLRVFDGAGNSAVRSDAFTVLKDTTPPAFTDNQGGDAQRRASAGTAYDVDVRDPASGLERFQYSVSTTQASADASVFGWFDVPLGVSTAAFTADWAVAFGNLLGDATNFVSVRAWDRAGSTSSLTDAFFVLKDTSGPRVGFSVPAAGFRSVLSALSGTAADDAGVAAVQVAVQTAPPSGNWFDGATFSGATPLWLAAAGTAAWTFTGVPAWTDGGAFRVVARAADGLANASVVFSTVDFTFDASTPLAGVTTPAGGATVSVLPTLSGTAFDPGPAPSGLSLVQVQVRRAADGFYWDWAAGAWGASSASSSPVTASPWSLPVPEALRASLASGASYFVSARGLDSATPPNAGSFAAGSTFTWTDSAAPSAITNLSALTGPSPGTLQLSWTAPGDDGASGDIALGSYRIHYSTDPATAFSTAAALVAFSTSGVRPGLKQGRLVTGLSAGATYHVRVFLADDAGNWSALSNGATAYAGNQPYSKITGHVMKASSEGVTAVLLEAYDTSDNRVSQTFSLADGSGTFSLDSVPDGVFRVQASWTADDITSSVWLDGVAVGSFNVDFMLEINYTLSTLTGTLASLSAQAASPAGFLTRAAEDGFAGARVDLLRGGKEVAAARPDPTGRWNIPNLLPGKYSVRAFNGLEYTDPQEVQLGEGETLEVVFVFDPLPEASVFAFPNPARSGTTFRFVSALPGLEAQVTIFDIAGTLVKEIPGSAFTPLAGGLYHADWDLTNDEGESVASGVYLFMTKVTGTNGQSGKVVKKLAVVR